MHDDLRAVAQPRISVITPSLNHGRFLRATIESIVDQSFRNFEHIVVDGGSSDDTVSILKEYPHIRWISEPDNHITEAYRKAISMARGDYVIQCCVSDGFVDKHWFRKCVEVLDKDIETSLVWGFPQYMSEDGALLNVSFQEFFNDPPPQKQEFLALWLVKGFSLPEGNYCVRSEIIKRYFPDEHSEQHFFIHPELGFLYEFMVRGYCPYFIPAVANYGRTHQDQRGQRLRAVEMPAAREYRRYVREYRRKLLSGKIIHQFRNGRSEVMQTIGRQDLWAWRKKIWRNRILRSRLLRNDPYSLVLKIKSKIMG